MRVHACVCLSSFGCGSHVCTSGSCMFYLHCAESVCLCTHLCACVTQHVFLHNIVAVFVL